MVFYSACRPSASLTSFYETQNAKTSLIYAKTKKSARRPKKGDFRWTQIDLTQIYKLFWYDDKTFFFFTNPSYMKTTRSPSKTSLFPDWRPHEEVKWSKQAPSPWRFLSLGEWLLSRKSVLRYDGRHKTEASQNKQLK